MMEDQVSECDSLEVIDMDAEISEALAEAAKDEMALKTLSEGRAVDKIPDSFTTSQYAQVIFHDVMDSYSSNNDVVCRYNITEGFVIANGDRIGLYRLPFLQPQEYVMYSWVKSSVDGGLGTVVFPAADLPKEADFYQFQYIKFDGTVAGASVPWHLNTPGEAEAGVEAEDLVMVQTPLSSLRLNNEALNGKVKDIEEKYNSLLEISEKLSDELNRKNASFVILDAKCRTLMEERMQTEEVKADLATLIAEKLVLEQSLHRANEIRYQAESEVKTLTQRIAVFQESLVDNNSELAKCEEARAAAEQQVRQLEQRMLQLEEQLQQLDQELAEAHREVTQLRSERARINTMLDTELTRRETCLAENQHLLSRLEDINAMQQATQKSKEMAIQEIRGMVQTQDLLRRELQQARDTIESLRMSKCSLEEEFVKTKDQLYELTRNGERSAAEHQDPAVQEVLASLGSKLEKAEQTIRNKEDHIRRQDAKLQLTREALERYEAELDCRSQEKSQFLVPLTEEVDRLTGKLASLQKEHEEQVAAMVDENLKLKQKLQDTEQELTVKTVDMETRHEEHVAALKDENLNLKQRLQVGAEHYKRLALEKERATNCNCQTYQDKIKELTEEVRSLRAEMQDGREEARLSFAQLKEVVTSEAESVASTASTYSGDSNMDSIRISACMERGARPRHPAMAKTAAPQCVVDSRGLPLPLEPENLDPYTSVKSNTSLLDLNRSQVYTDENGSLFPKLNQCLNCDTQFNPFSEHECSGGTRKQQSSDSQEQQQNCPICQEKFPEDITQEKMAEHIENHFGRECPFCLKIFEDVEVLELHVQTHMTPEQPEPGRRSLFGWDLGID